MHNAVEERGSADPDRPIIAKRVTDLYDIRDRTICQLRRLPDHRRPGSANAVNPGRARSGSGRDRETLSKDTVLGIIAKTGGPTSHTAILAAQLRHPAVFKAKGAEVIVAGYRVTLDGGVGEVMVSPDRRRGESCLPSGPAARAAAWPAPAARVRPAMATRWRCSPTSAPPTMPARPPVTI